MAEKCEGCDSKWAEAIYWTHFRTFHFSQVLGSDQQQLALPKKIVDNLKKKLPESVALKGPSGVAWNVRLTSNNDGLFFKDGWEEFVKDHSLGENDLLVFGYDGVSQFDVLVFDGQSSCEKEASYFVRKCGHTEHDKGCSTKRKLREGSPDEGHTHSDNGVGNTSLEKSINDDSAPVPSGQQAVKPVHAKRAKSTPGGGAEHTSRNVADVSKRRPVTKEEKENALHLAQAASTDKSFLIVMRPTHVYKRFFMCIPTEWTRRHLPIGKQDVFLCVGKKTWQTTYYYNHVGDYGGLGTGWKRFVLDNNLEEWDVCLFKLAGQANDSIILDVSIFRVVEEVTLRTPPNPATPKRGRRKLISKRGRRNLIKSIRA